MFGGIKVSNIVKSHAYVARVVYYFSADLYVYYDLINYRLTPDCIEDLASVIYGPKRLDLLSGLIQTTKFNSQLISCRWRVDITISSK